MVLQGLLWKTGGGGTCGKLRSRLRLDLRACRTPQSLRDTGIAVAFKSFGGFEDALGGNDAVGGNARDRVGGRGAAAVALRMR